MCAVTRTDSTAWLRELSALSAVEAVERFLEPSLRTYAHTHTWAHIYIHCPCLVLPLLLEPGTRESPVCGPLEGTHGTAIAGTAKALSCAHRDREANVR